MGVQSASEQPHTIKSKGDVMRSCGPRRIDSEWRELLGWKLGTPVEESCGGWQCVPDRNGGNWDNGAVWGVVPEAFVSNPRERFLLAEDHAGGSCQDGFVLSAGCGSGVGDKVRHQQGVRKFCAFARISRFAAGSYFSAFKLWVALLAYVADAAARRGFLYIY